MPHSKNKQTFLEEFKVGDESYKLWARDIEPLINYYAEKKGIRIIKNGQVNFLLIKQKQEKINLIIQKFEDGETKYTTYLQMYFSCFERYFWSSYNIEPGENDFEKHYSKIATSIEKYLTSKGVLRIDLSSDEIHDINAIISQLNCKELFDQKIKLKLEDLKHALSNASLTKKEAMQEVEEIRNGLKEDEIVAYIFTDNHYSHASHFEALIITKKAIIKPVIWDIYDTILPIDILADIPFYEPLIDIFFPSYFRTINPLPFIQADSFSCGSLSISALKKLLQNNALELKDFTLTFSIYHANLPNEQKHFFFPSPSMLRYAQSSKYILFLEKILQNADTVDYAGNKLFTLKALLTQSIQIATENKDMATVAENSKLLNELPIFRQKWLSAIEEVKHQRDEMTPKKDPNSGTQHNLYLAYTTRRLEKIAKQAPSSNNPSFFKLAASIDSTKIESSVNAVANRL